MQADSMRAEAPDLTADPGISLLPGIELPAADAPETLTLAGPVELTLPDLVLSRLRELIVEAPTGAQLESLVRVAERLPQWHSALGETQDETSDIEGMSLEEAVSEVRRIADLAEGAARQVKK